MAKTLPAKSQMALFPITEKEVDDIGMGVLSDGSPYLTLRGLAKLCGIDPTVLHRFTTNWETEKIKPRGRRVQELLAIQGHSADSLFVKIQSKGVDTHAYTDEVCMAILEYYAFETDQPSTNVALTNYRTLARSSFRSFIYNRCGYDPQNNIPESWRNYHERVLMNDQVPTRFFSVFREIADMVVHMIQADCPIDEHTVPDISVGQIWSKYWVDNNLEAIHGAREKHPHVYPEWFAQSEVNPVPAWIYPASALGVFRIWLYENYITEKFPKYIGKKVKSGVFLASRAELLIEAVSVKNIAHEQPKRLDSK